MELNKIYQGDCLDVLPTLPDNSVDSIVTDPPYELGFMGKSWDNSGIAYNVDMWKECLRVLKPGGHLLAFSGTRTYHRMTCAIEDAGFEVRDMIEWCYGSGFPKSLNIGKSVNQLERNEWSKISKAFDNIDQKSIMEVWKTNAKLAGIKLVKNLTGVGSNTRKKYFVHDIAVLYFNQEKENASAITAELNLCVPSRTSEENLSIAVGSVEQNTELSQELVKSVVKLSENQRAKSWNIFTAQCNVKEWLSENTEVNHKVDEALKTLRGNKKYSNEEITNVLCVVLTNALKLTILNQSKTFQNLGTNQKMECVSAINVIITEYTAENLISNTVAILKSKAVDKLQGNEREVVGESWNMPDLRDVGRMSKEAIGIDKLSFGQVRDAKRKVSVVDKGTSEWEGWGTALKPSHEPVVFCSKPLTPRLYFAILIGDISNNIIQLCQISNVKDAEKIFSGIQAKLEKEGVLSVADNVRINAWESLENVKFAEKSFTSKEQKSSDLTKTKESSAQLNAKQNGKKDNLQEIKTLAGVEENIKALMDIIIFGTTEDTSQNIALLWNNISEELLNQANTLTISMATRLITDLKILKLSATQSILESTGSLFKTPQNIPPNHEPICMARKPLSEKTVVENVLKYGTGGINIDESRVGTTEQDKYDLEQRNVSKGSGVETNINFTGRDLDLKHGVQELGRFPANLIHDNSEEVRECFPETKSSKGSFKAEDYEEHETSTNFTRGDFKGRGDSGNASRFFKSIIYQAKASKSERNKGCEKLEEKAKVFNGQSDKPSTDMKDVEKRFTTLPKANNHPTVKPIALCEYLIKMITPKGGIVLDPFAGSGSTLVAAKENGFGFIGIELTEDYIPIIEARTGVKAEKIQPIENVIQKTQTEPTSVIKEKPINTQKPKNDIDTCECGGRIVKTASGRCCEQCLADY